MPGIAGPVALSLTDNPPKPASSGHSSKSHPSSRIGQLARQFDTIAY